MEKRQMNDKARLARVELIDRLSEVHIKGMLNSVTDRQAFIAKWLAILELAKVADLSPLPVKEETLKPIPKREVIDSPEKLARARAKLAGLEGRERHLAAIAWNQQEARHDQELRDVRHEIACLNVEIKIASAMERTAHAG
jgi:hypothetical protein